MEEFDDFLFYKKDLIGNGAFAVVFKGRQKSKNTDVAIKAINKKNLNKTKALLKKEIQILKELSGLKHENLVGLLKCVETISNVYLVMEFCNGGDLAEYLLHKGAIDEVTIQHFFKQIARALEAINRKGIVHRDLKPQNILLCKPPHRADPLVHEIVVKLADFGFARVLQDGNMAGTLCGSPMYMAPEVIMSIKYDAKADLWSTGTIMYQCLTGKAPFLAQTPQALKNFYERNRELQPIIPSHCSDNLRDLLLKLLKRNAVDRIDFNDFFHHRFLHEPIVRSTSRRVLEQMSQANAHHRLSSPKTHTSRRAAEGPQSPVRRIQPADHHTPQSGLARPSSAVAANARPVPATYNATPAAPVKRRPDAVGGANQLSSPRSSQPRSLAGPADLHRPYDAYNNVAGLAHEQPPRPPKSQQQQPNQMTDSGEFTFLPPLQHAHSPRPPSRQSSQPPHQPESAVKQVQVHSQPPNSRAVPVPSQRLNFARMEQERQKDGLQQQNGYGPPQVQQEQPQPRPNFDEMKPRVEDMHPPSTKYVVKEAPKSRLPSASGSRLRKPSAAGLADRPNPDAPARSALPRPHSPTKPATTVDNIRYLSSSPSHRPQTAAKPAANPQHMKHMEPAADVDEEDEDDVLNDLTGEVPFASGLSVESSDSQMVDSVSGGEEEEGSTAHYHHPQQQQQQQSHNNPPASTSGLYGRVQKSAKASPTEAAPSATPAKPDKSWAEAADRAKLDPAAALEAPPGLEDETLMDEEHKQILAKLRFVLELTETLIGVAETNGSAISLNMDGSKRLKDPSTDAYRRAEQLVLYVKVMHIISSSLVMAQRHRDSATLQPSSAVQHVLNQLNDKYHQCLSRSQELASMGIPSGADPAATVVSAERIMYQHAIEMCQSAALDELYGNPHLCPSRYKRAYMMLHTLSEQVQSEQDRSVLSKYKDAVEKRLRILENQGYVIAISNK